MSNVWGPLGSVTASKSTASNITAANSSISIPANAYIDQVFVQNTTANAIVGGLKIGTTAGGVDVVAALAVGANALVSVFDAALLKRLFSTSSAQTLYIDAVTLWNSANINVTVVFGQL